MTDSSPPSTPSAKQPLSDREWNALVLYAHREIANQAATWEVDFDGQPGLVVGLMDAAIVAARLLADSAPEHER